MQNASDRFARAPVTVVGTARWTAPWLTEQNLAFALAERHPVLYVEPPEITPRRYARDGVARLRRERLRAREVVVYRPVVFPLRARAATARASAPLYRAQVGAVVRRLGMADGLLLTGDARPGVIGAAFERAAAYIVKDWVYDDPALLGRPGAELVAERDAICARVDEVLAISPALQHSLAEVGISSQILRHGFHADLVDAYAGPPPPEYRDHVGARIVFAGRIDGRLDVGKLSAVAARFSSASVMMIGPTSPRMPAHELAAMTEAPNIHLLGARPRAELPRYLAHASCLLIPYRDSVWAHHGSPLKLWDYLYAGPPIIGSGYSILKEYPSLVQFANDDEGFVARVAHALEHRDGAAERRRFAMANTWDARGRQLEEILIAAARRATARKDERQS